MTEIAQFSFSPGALRRNCIHFFKFCAIIIICTSAMWTIISFAHFIFLLAWCGAMVSAAAIGFIAGLYNECNRVIRVTSLGLVIEKGQQSKITMPWDSIKSVIIKESSLGEISIRMENTKGKIVKFGHVFPLAEIRTSLLKSLSNSDCISERYVKLDFRKTYVMFMMVFLGISLVMMLILLVDPL